MSDSDPDIITDTPVKTKKNKLKKHNYEIKIDEHEFPKSETTLLNSHLIRKQPYIYYELQKVASFTKNCFPRFNKLITVGTYNQNNLTEIKTNLKKKLVTITLDFKLLNAVPNSNDVIEIYGFIEFHNKITHVTFIVQIWKPLVGNIKCYLQLLKQKNKFIPIEYKEMNICNNRNNKFRPSELEEMKNSNEKNNWCADTLNNTLLVKQLDAIEDEIITGFEKDVNIRN